jgi:WD40 repeat protein
VNIETGESVYNLKLKGHRYQKGNGPRLSDDWKYIIYSEVDIVKIVEWETQEVVYSIKAAEEVYDAKLSPDNSYLVYYSFGNNLGVVSLSNLEQVFYQSVYDFEMSKLQFNNDNSFIALNNRQTLGVVDLKNNSVVWADPYPDRVKDLAFSKDGKYLISSAAGEIRVFSLQESKFVYSMKLGDQKSNIKIVQAAEKDADFDLFVQSNGSVTILALSLA